MYVAIHALACKYSMYHCIVPMLAAVFFCLCYCLLMLMQGTYEVNVLVAGRGATGISAIKSPARAGSAPVSKQH
jgi:hypothetical protein